jgi:hypothetical protein
VVLTSAFLIDAKSYIGTGATTRLTIGIVVLFVGVELIAVMVDHILIVVLDAEAQVIPTLGDGFGTQIQRRETGT